MLRRSTFSVHGFAWPAAAAICGAIGAATISVPVTHEPRFERPAAAATREVSTRLSSDAWRAGHPKKDADLEPTTKSEPRLLRSVTLVQTHTDERLALDAEVPTNDRFRTLLADRVTGASHEMDPRLLGLLRAIAERHPGARIELVSGFRSPKLNEAMRKKGHHVASHSQHSLGHAVDFRIVPPGETKGIEPRLMEKEIRALHWDGGVGVYPRSGDWFVHADVGRNRHWDN